MQSPTAKSCLQKQYYKFNVLFLDGVSFKISCRLKEDRRARRKPCYFDPLLVVTYKRAFRGVGLSLPPGLFYDQGVRLFIKNNLIDFQSPRIHHRWMKNIRIKSDLVVGVHIQTIYFLWINIRDGDANSVIKTRNIFWSSHQLINRLHPIRI